MNPLILQLLRDKGYTNNDNFWDVIKWFQSKGYLVTFSIISDNENITYSGVFTCSPYQQCYYTAATNTPEDALELLILQIINYIC